MEIVIFNLVTHYFDICLCYINCSVKSNDAKAALTMDGPRVQHQAKYLGACWFLLFYFTLFADCKLVFILEFQSTMNSCTFIYKLSCFLFCFHLFSTSGLAENIKVRRAGFAYRNDFHRFLDRFGILSPTTYPEWRGTDLVSEIAFVFVDFFLCFSRRCPFLRFAAIELAASTTSFRQFIFYVVCVCRFYLLFRTVARRFYGPSSA